MVAAPQRLCGKYTQDASQDANFIAGTLCLSLGSVFAWRATRKEVKTTDDNEAAIAITKTTEPADSTYPAGSLDDKSSTTTANDSQS